MATATATASRDILLRVRKLIPPLLPSFHKGQQGRVAVIGGSEDYTGAPFFSASASALLGADMSHVICEPQAAQVIKTYSPNLMVHPYMRQSLHAQPHETSSYLCEKIINSLLDRLHVIVVGPGLGRDKLMQETVGKVILEARKRGLPIVIDADGLVLVQNQPEMVKGYEQVVLTPNIMEFKRLCKTFDVQLAEETGSEEPTCSLLAKALGGVTVVQKGQKDCISNGKITWTVDLPGGLKRSGGQGDTLTGTLATFLAWKAAYENRLWEHDNSLSKDELIALCAYGAAATTRYCSRAAFVKKGRALQASDLMNEIANAYKVLFEEDLSEDVLSGEHVGNPVTCTKL